MATPSMAPHHTMTNSPRNHGKARNAMREDERPPTTETSPPCCPAASPAASSHRQGAACKPPPYYTRLQGCRLNAYAHVLLHPFSALAKPTLLEASGLCFRNTSHIWHKHVNMHK